MKSCGKRSSKDREGGTQLCRESTKWGKCTNNPSGRRPGVNFRKYKVEMPRAHDLSGLHTSVHAWQHSLFFFQPLIRNNSKFSLLKKNPSHMTVLKSCNFRNGANQRQFSCCDSLSRMTETRK